VDILSGIKMLVVGRSNFFVYGLLNAVAVESLTGRSSKNGIVPR
jgi:hypothetical protein